MTSYTYSWDRTHTLSPADFVQEQNDLFDLFSDEESEINSVFISVSNFDTDEIL